MTTTESPNYTRVAPSPAGSANGNGSGSGKADGGPHAPPRAEAREGRSVSAVLGAVRRVRADRRVAATDRVVDVGDRPDLFHRPPLSLARLWERIRDDVGQRWEDEERLAAVVLLLFGVVFAMPVTAVGYGFTFCAQEWYRALWLVLGLAVLVIPLFAL